MVLGRKSGRSDTWPFLVRVPMPNSYRYHQLTSFFRNRFVVVPGGTFFVAHETCRTAPVIVAIIILVTNALLVDDASAVARPEHIWLSTISLRDALMRRSTCES
jgi:hypothetical protein